MDLAEFKAWQAEGHPELDDVSEWEEGFTELRNEQLLGAAEAWRAAPIHTPERSLLVILRFGRRLRKLLHLR